MLEYLKKIPMFIVLSVISLLYLIIGFLVGYYFGYQSGQEDYLNYLNNLTK
jgi:hypothetical protein